MNYVDLHFLNVGHGDCTIIDHASRHLTMIDINNSKSLPESDEIALAAHEGLSLDMFKSAKLAGPAFAKRSWEDYYRSLLVDPYDYLTTQFDGRPIFRYIQTHPDMDHMSGLCRVFWQGGVELLNFWDTANEKEFAEEDFTNSPHDYMDWLVYKVMRAGGLKDGANHKVFKNLMNDSREYWSSDGLTVLNPTQDIVDYTNRVKEWNNISYVLRLDYGGRRVILPGDAEKPAWDSVEANFEPEDLTCDILKASHHGRESGYSETAATAMDPSIVICSVGKKPDTDASDEYASLGARVLSTRYNGTIKVTIWEDGEVWVKNNKGETIESLPALP